MLDALEAGGLIPPLSSAPGDRKRSDMQGPNVRQKSSTAFGFVSCEREMRCRAFHAFLAFQNKRR